MDEPHLSALATWLVDPLSQDVRQSVRRLCESDDVQHVALMPDVHLAKEVCIGAVVATEQLVYPEAVGGDIGCGMAALAFDADAAVIDNQQVAAGILAGLYECVPCNKHRQPRTLPAHLRGSDLSDDRLQRLAQREGRVQLGTLGRGNHFLEFQADQAGRLWVMVHSGSRALGQAVMSHSLKESRPATTRLRLLDSSTTAGQSYLSDMQWARAYAAANRFAMLQAVCELLERLLNVKAEWESLIHSDHNHVQREQHFGKTLWVHRKGAQSAAADEAGIVPGSMGTVSFHTLGRGEAEALCSSAHGAGRRLSRAEARRKIGGREFARQVGRLWYDHRRADKLRDEAPAAYKDIRRVMKAQRDLTAIVRELRPLLTYKGV